MRKIILAAVALATLSGAAHAESDDHDGLLSGYYQTPEAMACTVAIEDKINRTETYKYDTSITRQKKASIQYPTLAQRGFRYGGHIFVPATIEVETFRDGEVVDIASLGTYSCVLDDDNHVMGMESN